MMQISPKLHEAVARLVNEGKYSSIENFTETAVRNLLALEQEYQSNEGISNFTPVHQNALLVRPLTIEPAQLDNERKNFPIWGLINRYAPAKMVLRELSSEIALKKVEWTDFKQFAESVVLKATKLRTELEKREKATNLVRGEALQTGFPQKDVRSQQRFVNLYIGRLRSNNRIDGLLGDLELATIRKNSTGNLQIGITQAGLEWSLLRSTFLDETSSDSELAVFSEQERRFLLSHISRVRPGEFSFLNYLFTSIKNGIKTPEQLTTTVRSYSDSKGWKNAKGERISDAEVNTLKVGGVARLVETRLIRIEKNGIRTSYSANDEINDLNAIIALKDGGN